MLLNIAHFLLIQSIEQGSPKLPVVPCSHGDEKVTLPYEREEAIDAIAMIFRVHDEVFFPVEGSFGGIAIGDIEKVRPCLLYTSPSPRDRG